MADLATQWPDEVGFQAINFRVVTPTQRSETFSGKIRRVGLGTSYYTWQVQYGNLEHVDRGSVMGFVSQALGPQFSFEIVLPYISQSSAPNQTTSTPTVVSTASLGATSVTVTGCGASKNVLAAGDLLKFSNHSKCYMATSPVVSDGSGNATIFFTSPLVSAVPGGSTVVIDDVPLTAILEDDEQEFQSSFGGISTMQFNMREVF